MSHPVDTLRNAVRYDLRNVLNTAVDCALLGEHDGHMGKTIDFRMDSIIRRCQAIKENIALIEAAKAGE